MRRLPPARTTAERDPLGPLDTLVSLLLAVAVAFALFAAVITVMHALGKSENTSVYSFSKDVCVESDNFTAGSEEEPPVAPYAEPGSRMFSSGTTFCTKNPSLALQLAASTEGLLSTVLLVGACLLARRTIRAARREGLFSARPARLLRTLGWFLIAMSVIGPLGADVGNGIFLAAATTSETGLTWTSSLNSIAGPDWTPLILGVVAITCGRVMSRGMALQEEVDLTVGPRTTESPCTSTPSSRNAA